jgi:hypothetical protein
VERTRRRRVREDFQSLAVSSAEESKGVVVILCVSICNNVSYGRVSTRIFLGLGGRAGAEGTLEKEFVLVLLV